MNSKDESESSEVTTMASETEVSLEDAMKNIFTACDSENKGLVPTSNLIEYISPFMGCNMVELMQLNEMLDPEGKNILVCRDTFYTVMREWAARISAANDGENFYEANSRNFFKNEDEDFPFVQSTPRSSFGNHFLKGYTESGITNISLLSECSTASAAPDKTLFEEQLKELLHHNRKLTEELTQAKVQLSSNEEIIENLQVDLDKVVRRLTSEQQTNVQLQNDIRNIDNTVESHGDILLQYNELKNQKIALEKEYLALQDNFFTLKDEKSDLMEQVEKHKKKKCELKQMISELTKEVSCHEEKLSETNNIIERLKNEIKELQNIGENYKLRSEELVTENQSLEKLLHKLQLQQNLTATSNRPCHFRNSYCGPTGTLSNSLQNANTSQNLDSNSSSFEKIRQHCFIFNSPNLVKQLSNPLSPLSKTLDEKICCDSPDFVSVIKSSTPKQIVTLLDDSIPLELAKISVLRPIVLKTMENAENTPESPSIVYVIERSEGEQLKASEAIQGNNTSEEDYWKVNLSQMLERQSPHESLHAEISEADASCVSEKQCTHSLQLREIKHAYQNLQREILEHENCEYVIRKLEVETEKLEKQNKEYLEKINKLSSKINELNCHLSLDKSNSPTTYITEVRMHLDQEAGDANSCVDVDYQKETLICTIKALEQDNNKLLGCIQEKQSRFEIMMSNLNKLFILQKKLKTEIQTLLYENNNVKEIIGRNAKISEKYCTLYQQYSSDKIQWGKEKEIFAKRIADSMQEISELRLKWEKSETSSEVSNSSTDHSVIDDLVKERKHKGMISFSKMQMKVDKLQEIIENQRDLLQDKQLKNEQLQRLVSIAEKERCELELKLSQMSSAVEDNKTFKTIVKSVSENTFQLKEIMINISNTVQGIYNTHVEFLSLLENRIISQTSSAGCRFQSSFTSLLNSWSHISGGISFSINMQCKEQTFDTIVKDLTIHTTNLTTMVSFNKELLDLLVVLLSNKQHNPINNSVILFESESVLRPESPDSPSQIIIPESTGMVNDICPKFSAEISSISSTSLNNMDKPLLQHPNKKEDDVLLSNFEEISFTRAFPNLPDVLIEFLNILQDSPWKTITDREIEEKYTILMTAFTIDGSSIKLRQERQMIHLTKLKKMFLADLHKFAGNCTPNKLQDITHAFSQVCASAEIYGGVQEELNVHKCIALVKSYIMILNKKLEVQLSQSPSRLSYPGNHRKNNRNWFFQGICILILLIFVTILGNVFTDLVLFGDDVRTFSYRWSDLFWDDLLAVVTKKEYCTKECPY